MTEKNKKEVLKDIEVMISSCIMQGKFVEEDAMAILNYILKIVSKDIKENSEFSNAKVGDKAWSIMWGDCVIDSIGKKEITVVGKDIDNNPLFPSFYKDGKYLPTDKAPSLFKVNPFEMA